jgi:hypothetical protein
MKPGKWFTVFALVSTCWGVATGCSDDDDSNNGGAAGKAGSAGKGGSSGSGGTAGSAGTAGSDGSAGSAGTAGSAGSDAGDAGTLKLCKETCEIDDDCAPAGSDAGGSLLFCNQGKCEDPAGCKTALACHAVVGGLWTQPCSVASPVPDGAVGALSCSSGFACVDVGNGVGLCAPFPGDGGCGFLTPDLIVAPTFGGDGGTVSVCGNKDLVCNSEGVCGERCTPGNCGSGRSFCNTDTGACGCADDGECSAELGGAKCNLTTHKCGCATSADCAGVANADVCVNGVCGCSGSGVCTAKVWSGTTSACE